MTNDNDSAETSLTRAIAHNGHVLATLDRVTASWLAVAAAAPPAKAGAKQRRRRRRGGQAASP